MGCQVMSKAAYASSLLKLITLVPVIILLYYSDYAGWFEEFVTERLLGLLVVALTLLCYGVYLKRRVFGAYLNLSSESYLVGVLAIVASAAFFLIGSFFAYRYLFHFESLLVLVLAYAYLRFDKRMAQQLAPLLVLPGLVLVDPVISLIAGPVLSAVYLLLLMLGIFALYVELQGYTLIISGIIVTLGLADWFASSYSIGPYLIPVVPLSLVMLAIPGLRKKTELTERAPPSCSNHLFLNRYKYCEVCGRKVDQSGNLKSGWLGLLVLLLIATSILIPQVPVFSINSGVPTRTEYSFAGVTNSPFLETPVGWLINSSTPLNISQNTYVSHLVYVPSYHPERSNYTVVTAVGSGQLSLGSGTGGELQGWNITLHQLFSLGQYSGYLTGYVTGNLVMMNFAGFSQAYFLSGSKFEYLNLGLSFTRIFKGVQLANASYAFTGDLNSVFLPTLESTGNYVAWTDFLRKAQQSAGVLSPYLGMVSLASMISGIAYSLDLSAYRMDDVLTRASGLDSTDWNLFKALSRLPRRKLTGSEISVLLGGGVEGGSIIPESFMRSLERLIAHGFFRERFSARGADVLLTWERRF